MKNRFYFLDAGFRQKKAWTKVQKELEETSRAQGGQLNLDRNNEDVLRGVYREEELKTILVYDQKGDPQPVELKSFSSCDFLLRRKEEVLIVKNPSRGSLRSLISLFEDVSQFQMFAEPPTWDLWSIMSRLEKDDTDRVITKIEVVDFPYSNSMEGSLVVTGNLILENLEQFRNGRLVKAHGSYSRNNAQRFVVQSNGVLKVSGNMNFDDAISFIKDWS